MPARMQSTKPQGFSLPEPAWSYPVGSVLRSATTDNISHEDAHTRQAPRRLIILT